jgi:hypothetical protein
MKEGVLVLTSVSLDILGVGGGSICSSFSSILLTAFFLLTSMVVV